MRARLLSGWTARRSGSMRQRDSRVTDELTGPEFRWGQGNYVRLDPAVAPAHILTVALANRSRPRGFVHVLLGRGTA